MPQPLAHMSKNLKNTKKLLMDVLDTSSHNQILLFLLREITESLEIFKEVGNITAVIQMHPFQIPLLNPTPHGDGIRRWGRQEVFGSWGWSPHP